MEEIPMIRKLRSRWLLAFLSGAVVVAAVPAVNIAAAVDGQQFAAQFDAPMGTVSFANVVEAVSPAVVNIAVTKTSPVVPAMGAPGSRRPGQRGNSPMDEFFGRYFEAPSAPRTPRDVQGLGSGFIIAVDGYVVTNHHVISDASEITVTLSDGRQFDATLVGEDPKTDLALLKVEDGDDLPFVKFGDSDTIRAGDWVLAIGNPFGLGGTATAGIVSARGRDIQSGPYDDYLQIDAPINSGNSGGPVFNALGEVIGVNTAIYSPSGGNVGIGFAIPANQTNAVIAELKESGSVNRGWLGVQIQELDDDLATSFGMENTTGALIADVVAGSPAAKAGLRIGDAITHVGAVAIDSPRALMRLVGDTDPNERVRLTIWRDHAKETITVTLGEAQAAQVATVNPSATAPADTQFGLGLTALNAEHRAQLGLADDLDGVLIANVERDSPAANKGLRPGDVLMQVNGADVTTPQAAVAAITSAKSDSGQAMLLVKRGDSQRFVSLPLA
jgi:serine protease Do